MRRIFLVWIGLVALSQAAYDTIANVTCPACSSLITQCRNSSACTGILENTIGYSPSLCSMDITSLTGALDAMCTNYQTDCSSGTLVNNTVQCLLATGCYAVWPDWGDEEVEMSTTMAPQMESTAVSNCSCDLLAAQCFFEPTGTCFALLLSFGAGDFSAWNMTIEEDFESNPFAVFGVVHDVCNLASTDCTIFYDLLLCSIGCDDGSSSEEEEEDEDEDECFEQIESAMIKCMLSPLCYPQMDMFLFPIIALAEEEDNAFAMSPIAFNDSYTAYCGNASNYCDPLFITVAEGFVGCTMQDCVWASCGQLMQSCLDDDACLPELSVVANFGDVRLELYTILKEYYCSEFTATGSCNAKVDTLFQCVVDNQCIDVDEEDQDCFQQQCTDAAVLCAANDACKDTFVGAFFMEDSCEEAALNSSGVQCPDDCDNAIEAAEIAEYFGEVDNLCVAWWLSMENPAVLMPNISYCAAQCEKCEELVFALAEQKCTDAACQSLLVDVVGCQWGCELEEETEETEEDYNPYSCLSGCGAETVRCYMDEDCLTDVEWFMNVETEVPASAGLQFDTVPFRLSVLSVAGCTAADLTAAWTAYAAGGSDLDLWRVIFGCKVQDLTAYCAETGSVCNQVLTDWKACVVDECVTIPTEAPTMNPTAPTSSPTTAVANTQDTSGARGYQAFSIAIIVALSVVWIALY